MIQVAEEIKGLCLQQRIPVFGMAESSKLEKEPQRYRPSDVLPSARSLLCLGIPVPKGIFQSGKRSTENYWRTANVYYRHVDAVLLQAARMLEEQGEVAALPVFGCFPYDVRGPGDFWGYLCLVRMAEAVGIGKIGKNGLLFNSRYGPRLILGGIITTAELEPVAWPQRDEAGCPETCFECQAHCPVGAIGRQGNVDRVACLKHSMKSPIFSYLMKSGAFPSSDAQMINHVAGVDDHSVYTCIQCVASCPFALNGSRDHLTGKCAKKEVIDERG